jgi:hypothetical protein
MNVGIILLLHGSGWDELLMVVVGLLLAFVVISATGRRDGAAEGGRDETPEDPQESR